MKNLTLVSAAAALMIALLVIGTGYSDDAAKPGQKAGAKPAAEKTETKKRKAPRGRLPNYYGQVGISEQQRESIYSIQSKYDTQIDELRKQMADLVAKRDGEIEAVLTDAQKESLVKAREEAKKRALERAKERAAEKAAETKAGDSSE